MEDALVEEKLVGFDELRQELVYLVRGSIRANMDRLETMAERTGVNRTHLSQLSRGRSDGISFDRLALIARAFGVSFESSVAPCEPMHVHGYRLDGVIADSKETNVWVFEEDL